MPTLSDHRGLGGPRDSSNSQLREHSTMPGRESYLWKNHRSSVVSGFGFRLAQIQNSFTIPLPSQFAGFRERAKGPKGKFEQKHILSLQGLLAGNSRSPERGAEPENPTTNHSPRDRMGGKPHNNPLWQVRSQPLAPM